MKKVLWVLSSLALVGMGFVGCDDEDKDACDNKCEDGQVCALVRDAGDNYKCMAKASIDASCLNGDVFREGKILVKDGNDYLCENNESTHTNRCDKDNDCSGTTPHCNLTSHTCEAAAAADEFKFVRIDDATESVSGSDPGADIDAVVLVKGGDYANGAKIYAKAVHDYVRGDGKSSAQDKKIYAGDPNKILEAPDSVTTYGTDASEAKCLYYANGSNNIGQATCNADGKDFTGKTDANQDCDFNYTFVSLGGKGGHIIVEMNGKIEAGDKLDIVEVGDCKLSNTASGDTLNAKNENMTVGISISKDANSFKSIGTGKATKGFYSITISDANLK